MAIIKTLSGNIISVDLETRDFEGFRSAVLDEGGLADSYYPIWSDRSQADIGVALTEAFSFYADIISYYQDRCANEALFATAVQRRSVIEHAKLIGYSLQPAVSAKAELTFVATGSGTVPAGTKVQVDATDGSTPLTFELVSAFSPAGAGTTTGVLAYEGSSVSEVLGSSDGSADQQFELGSSPLALNPDGTSSLAISIETGGVDTVYTQVDNFNNSSSTDNHFRIEIDENDTVTVIFSDGVNGSIPASGTNNVKASYRVGGGQRGNAVAKNKLTRIVGSFPFISSVTNPEKPTAGKDREAIEISKRNGPLSLKAMDRAVTHQDFAVLAAKVPGVLHSVAYRGNGPLEERIVIATGGSNPVPSGTWDPYTEIGTGLIGAVGQYVNNRKNTPTILYIDPVRVIRVILSLNVFLFGTIRREYAKRLIDIKIKDLFKNENQTLGLQVPLSKVDSVVERILGIDYVNIVQMQRIPNPYHLPFGSSTDLSIGSFIVGSETAEDTYTVYMTSATTFDVVGEATGNQGSGTVGTQFTASGGYFKFTATAGTIPATNADKFRFKTGVYRGNINPEFDEIALLYNDDFQLNLVGGKV